jgi:outer membrane protein
MNLRTLTGHWLERLNGLRGVVAAAGCTAVLCGLPKLALATDLVQAFHEALVNDATYAMAKASRDAGREKLPLGRAALLPNLSLSGNTAWNKLHNTSDGFKTQYNSNGYSVQLTQPLFNWPAWEGYKQGELQAATSEEQFIADTQDLIVRVAQAYFDVLAATEVLDAQEALKAASLEQLDLTKSSLEAGTVPITDVNEAQSRFDLASAQVIGAKNDLEVKRFALGRLTGSAPENLAGLPKAFVLAPPQPEDMKRWTDVAVKENPAIKAKQMGFEYAMREVNRNAGARYPTVDLVTSRQESNTVNTFNGVPNNTEQNTIMLQMNLPLYSGGRVSAKEREAVAMKERARADLQDTTNTIVQAARQNYLGVMSGLAQLKGLESAGASSASALDSIKAGYEIGVRANVDVLNAQSQVADTRQRLVRARVETLMSLLRLKAAAGQLGEHDLAEIDALLAK